jgi:hypothetical protein
LGTGILTQSDPTDNALAAIASILDNPETHRGPETPPPADDTSLVPERGAADGYSRVGPGPMAAIRFKWTVRRADDGHYYVDETIGETTAVVTGPMSADAAVKLVDERESEARRRFEALRSEMAGRSAAANLAHKDGEV